VAYAVVRPLDTASPVTSLILLVKIAVPPVLIALMSLAARRLGPTIGGLFVGLPWMTGPVFYFLATDKGPPFAGKACLGILLAVISIAAFVLVFGLLARRAPWPVCLLAGVAGFFAVAYPTQDLDLPLWAAALAGVASLLGAFVLLPKPRAPSVLGRLPWWDIPARMGTAFVLVAGIMLGAEQFGPQLSGILASYPVIMTVIGSFTLQQWGADAVLRLFASAALSMISFVIFFLIVGYAMAPLGLAAAFAVATAAAVAYSAALIAVRR
jgi:hypothetical protein